jgi:hypothetical protein
MRWCVAGSDASSGGVFDMMQLLLDQPMILNDGCGVFSDGFAQRKTTDEIDVSTGWFRARVAGLGADEMRDEGDAGKTYLASAWNEDSRRADGVVPVRVVDESALFGGGPRYRVASVRQAGVPGVGRSAEQVGDEQGTKPRSRRDTARQGRLEKNTGVLGFNGCFA